MELQFHKSVIPCVQTLMREMQSQEQTQEVRLTDGMPDIGSVLASWGQIVIRGKEWRSDGANVSGGVMVWVLYAPEDGTQPQSVEAWLPFQSSWRFPEAQRDGSICVMPILSGVDARCLSARKLMVRANIGVLGEMYVKADCEISQPCDLPEDVQILKNDYPLQLPTEAGEKAFSLEETISVPGAISGIHHLIRYALRPELIDQKVVADKLVMRGVATLEVLYHSNDGKIHSWDVELPFSQYAELDKEHEPNSFASICFAVTGLELDLQENGELKLNAGITGQYVIYDCPLITVVEDAYSPKRPVAVQVERVELPSLLDRRGEIVRAETQIQTDILQPEDLVFYPNYPQSHRSGDVLQTELTGVFQLLGYDAEGQLKSDISRWEGAWSLDVCEDVGVKMAAQPNGKPQTAAGADGIVARQDIAVDICSVQMGGIAMVSGLQVGEMGQSNPDRPGLILRRAGTDRLWDIAKRTGSTVDAIMQANGLQQEPNSDTMLLIPVI